MATLAVQGGAVADEELPPLGLPVAHLAELAARGVAARTARGWTPTRAGPIAALLRALGGEVVRAAHARAAAALPAHAEQRALHLALSGDAAAAERLFLGAPGASSGGSEPWAAAEALLEAATAEARLEIASTLQRVGRAARAREVLEHLLASDEAGGLGACMFRCRIAHQRLLRVGDAAKRAARSPCLRIDVDASEVVRRAPRMPTIKRDQLVLNRVLAQELVQRPELEVIDCGAPG